MSETHEHLEHAEHARHAALDPFSSRVAMTMAIIAALLAAVTLLSHRAHGETLQLQGEANRLFTDADINHTNAANQWGYYQAKNIRRHNYLTDVEFASFLTIRPEKEQELKEAQERWNKQLADYKEELPKHRGDAEQFMAVARQKEETALQKLKESHHRHEQGTRFDLGELAFQLGLVLCSIAILTKRREFWYSGIVAAVLGALVAATVLFMSPHAEGHDHDTPTTEHHATDKGAGH
jgi:hypothetical protein